MGTRSIGTPCTSAVHRLSTTLSRALLVRVCVWAAMTVVGRNCAHSIGSAPLVLVITVVVDTAAIGTKASNTVYRLTAALSDTGDLAIVKWTFLTIQVSLGGHLVRSAALVLVGLGTVFAAAIDSPLAFAIHWLAATTLRALLQVISVCASITIVHGHLAHTVDAAALVLVATSLIVANIIFTPGSDTVHWLSATLVCALLVSTVIFTAETIVSLLNHNLKFPTPPITVVINVMVAE